MRTTAIIAMAGIVSASTSAQVGLQDACKDTAEWTKFTEGQKAKVASAKKTLDEKTTDKKTACPDAKADKLKKCSDAENALATATSDYKTATDNVASNNIYAGVVAHQNAW
jgi:hypothetical protein